jgi:hypothetical protein
VAALLEPEPPLTGARAALLRREQRGRTFVGLIVAAAVLALASSWSGAPSDAFWFWVAACFAAELLWVRLPFGNVTLSMASACNFAALLLLPRGEAMVAAAGAGLIAEALILRKPPARVLFNAAQSALAVFASASTLGSLSGNASLGTLLSEHRLLPLLVAAVVYTAVNYGAVSAIVAITSGISPLAAWRRNFGSAYEQVSNAALFSIGTMIAVLYTLAGAFATVIASGPLLLAWVSYRHWTGGKRPKREAEEGQRAA